MEYTGCYHPLEGEVVIYIDLVEFKIRVDSNDTAETISAKIQKIFNDERGKYYRTMDNGVTTMTSKFSTHD